MSSINKKNLRFMTTDNGGEFRNSNFYEFNKSHNIAHKCSVPNHSFQNGIAERAIRTVRHITNKILNSANIKPIFWSDCIQFACFVHNRRPNIKLKFKTPIEIFAPNLSETRKLIKFGSQVYFVDYSESKSHLYKRPGVLLGYPLLKPTSHASTFL